MNKTYLSGEKEAQAKYFLQEAIEVAKKAWCHRSKCGAIIVNKGEIISEGINHPPGFLESQRRCHIKKNKYNQKVTDKTCCIHAEQHAISNALNNNPKKLNGSTLFFVRLDMKNNFKFAGEPYCTICSKFALDIGIKKWVLWHKDGIVEYNSEEYNNLSFNYKN
jgi:deoxycytidylate deaminase